MGIERFICRGAAKFMNKNYKMGKSLTQHQASEVKGLIDSCKVFATYNRPLRNLP